MHIVDECTAFIAFDISSWAGSLQMVDKWRIKGATFQWKLLRMMAKGFKDEPSEDGSSQQAPSDCNFWICNQCNEGCPTYILLK